MGTGTIPGFLDVCFNVYIIALAGVAQWVGATAHAPEGPGFDSRSGHIPRLQVLFPVLLSTGGNWQHSHISISPRLPSLCVWLSLPPALSLPPFLNIYYLNTYINTYIQTYMHKMYITPRGWLYIFSRYCPQAELKCVFHRSVCLAASGLCGISDDLWNL